jgi:uncharacterized membrane protein YgcG
LVVSAAAQTNPTFPVLTSRITDQAGLLSADDYTAIMAELAALEQKSTDQFAVVTVNPSMAIRSRTTATGSAVSGASAKRARTTASCSSSPPTSARYASRWGAGWSR